MGHGVDFGKPKPTDSEELIAAREIIVLYLREFLHKKNLLSFLLGAKISEQFENSITITKKKIVFFINSTDDLINFKKCC